jgi:hypothetical protein
MLADAIDIPLVLGFGLIVLLPLLLFEIGVEAFVLKKIWHIPFLQLCRFTLFANCWSLLAGIPVKILNAWLYGFMLPEDLHGFFTRYGMAVVVGSFIYFLVTLAVEGAYAFRWLRKKEFLVASGKIWKGIFLANLASYAVLAPLHYYFTRPIEQVREFTSNVNWSSNPTTKVIFVDSTNSNLHLIQLNVSGSETIVPIPVRDYLLSADLNICLFRGTNGSLYLYRHDAHQSNLIWQTKERFLMNQVAFSPSGRYAAFASEESNAVTVVNLQTGQRIHQSLLSKFSGFSGSSITWSTNEMIFYASGFENNERLLFTIRPGDMLSFNNSALSVEKLTNTNMLPLLTCYGRVGSGGWYSSDDWGRSFNEDSCGSLTVWTEPGLGSSLRISEQTKKRTVLYLSVNPGLLHIARFYFGDAAFLSDCNECLFEANDYLYLLDISDKKVGTVAHGERFILLTPRYQKLF